MNSGPFQTVPFPYSSRTAFSTIEEGTIFIQRPFPVIHKLDATTGQELQKFKIKVQQGGISVVLIDPISALASDGTFLYAGVKGTEGVTGAWFKIDPTSPGATSQRVDEFAGILGFMPGFESFELTMGAEALDDRRLLASGHTSSGPDDTIARFDRNTGVMFDQFVLGGRDIKGMAYIGRTLFVADDVSDSILGTALPENTLETTIVGSYDSQLKVDGSTNPDFVTESPLGANSLADFNIIRNPSVVVNLTNPLQGFVATTTSATIAGLISDPSIG